jgi:sulfatase maturation enzyme AslB (radical SAM superfamily)
MVYLLQMIGAVEPASSKTRSSICGTCHEIPACPTKCAISSVYISALRAKSNFVCASILSLFSASRAA